jgi:hypothetical protein
MASGSALGAAALAASLQDLTSNFNLLSYTGGVQDGYSKLGANNLFCKHPRERGAFES